jgi:hypothetical protein
MQKKRLSLSSIKDKRIKTEENYESKLKFGETDFKD